MYYPRRALDEQGRNVQFAKSEPVRLVILAVLGTFIVLMGVVEAATGSMSSDDGPGVGIILIFLGFIPCFGAYYVYRRAKAWYYEDDYGFEMLTPFLYKKVAVSYNDIASWRIDENPRNGESALVVKTHDRKKVFVPVYTVRPLILLKTLVTMETEGRFGTHRKPRWHKIAINQIEREYRRHVDLVYMEMKKTGIHIDIPER